MEDHNNFLTIFTTHTINSKFRRFYTNTNRTALNSSRDIFAIIPYRKALFFKDFHPNIQD
jgi:hypothetical protein